MLGGRGVTDGTQVTGKTNTSRRGVIESREGRGRWPEDEKLIGERGVRRECMLVLGEWESISGRSRDHRT